MRATFFFICSLLLLACEPPRDLSNAVEVNSSKNSISTLEHQVSESGNSCTPDAEKEILISEKENPADEPLFFLLLEFTH